ncbi:MAG TPA: acyl-CoA dehydratase activase [Blastocatellia bacterium]|nr:acyl-CoA dehydratase activase [Blastocatellia bacterium]
MICVAGIDVGSGLTKAVILQRRYDDAPRLIGRALVRTGTDLNGTARRAFERALDAAGISPGDVVYIAATGFGRASVDFRDIQITDITSAARGAWHLLPGTRSVLDIGSQSTRAISLTEGGKVHLFKSNDKCAAGSGSFIVRAARYLQVDLESVGVLSLRATHPQPISSVCAVLAESEIINHVSAGVSVEDILRGIHNSLADRAALLLRRVGLGSDLTFIGGVARQQGMIRALEDRLNIPVRVPEECEYVCALGAALLGLQRYEALSRQREVMQEVASR